MKEARDTSIPGRLPKSKLENALEDGEMSPRAVATARHGDKVSREASGRPAAAKAQAPEKQEAAEPTRDSSRQSGKRKAEEAKAADSKRKSMDTGVARDKKRHAARSAHLSEGRGNAPSRSPIKAQKSDQAVKHQRRSAARDLSEEHLGRHEASRANGRANGRERIPAHLQHAADLNFDEAPGLGSYSM